MIGWGRSKQATFRVPGSACGRTYWTMLQSLRVTLPFTAYRGIRGPPVLVSFVPASTRAGAHAT